MRQCRPKVSGRHWTGARFIDVGAAPDAWQRWQYDVDVAPGRYEMVVRAIDDAGQSQPERANDVWNFAG